MGIKALLMGISLFEVGMLYWLLCGTVLEKEYFKKKRLGNFMCEYCRGRYRCRRKSQSDIFFAVCIYYMYRCHMYMCVIDKWAV